MAKLFLTNIDLNKNQLLNSVVQNLATAPANPSAGQIYYNTVSKNLFYYNGNSWIQADGLGATMTGEDIVTALNGSTSIIDDDNLSTAVNDAIAKAHDTHTIAMVSGLQTALDGKVDDSQVLSDVPANAKFTDTTYTTFTDSTDGLAPASGGGTTKYLRADGTWVVPPNTIYTLSVATAGALGGVKSGTDITVDASGNVSVNDDSHNHVIANIDGLETALADKETLAGATAKASTAEANAKSYTDTAISTLLDSAPGTLDTLNELAAALGDDPNFATTVTNQIAAKADKYFVAFGDGVATSYVITHNLNSRDLVCTVRQTGSPYAEVIPDVEFTTVNTVTVRLSLPPATNAYTITLIG